MKILFVNACVRKNSRTLLLARKLLTGLDGEVRELKLDTLDLKPLNEDRITTRLTNQEEQLYALEFASADLIVIAAPLWDLSFPALLKIYIENITITGITFKYTASGLMGLCKAKKLIYISTSGGNFIPNYGFEYIKSLANTMFGIPDVKCFNASGLDVWGNDVDSILKETEEEIKKYLTE